MSYSTDRYYYRKSHGLCVDCGEPVDGDRVCCAKCNERKNAKSAIYGKEHREERNKKRREKRAMRLAMGLCVDCGKENHNGKALCDACSERKNKQARERKAYLKKVGRCTCCGAEVPKGRRLCAVCHLKEIEREEKRSQEEKERINKRKRQLENEKYKERKDNGLCPSCGGEIDDKAYATCSRCRARRRTLWRMNSKKPDSMKKENGICLWCDDTAVSGYCYCEKHLQEHRESAAYARKFAKHDIIRKYLDASAREAKWKRDKREGRREEREEGLNGKCGQ